VEIPPKPRALESGSPGLHLQLSPEQDVAGPSALCRPRLGAQRKSGSCSALHKQPADLAVAWCQPPEGQLWSGCDLWVGQRKGILAMTLRNSLLILRVEKTLEPLNRPSGVCVRLWDKRCCLSKQYLLLSPFSPLFTLRAVTLSPDPGPQTVRRNTGP
jgi:hypothetical protein